MLFQSTFPLMLLSLGGITTAAPAPINAIPMGSKHNLYLTTCTRRAGLIDCPIIGPCSQPTYSSIAYFANGPIASSGLITPTSMPTVSTPAQPWEGVTRSVRLDRASTITASIDAAATTIGKGEIAGSAKLDTEDFVCFKDGATAFEVRDARGGQYSCVTDYWCPSIAA